MSNLDVDTTTIHGVQGQVMSSGNIEYARQVCLTCKSRKKRCDKVVPICGYCSKRCLPCCYDYSPISHDDRVVRSHYSDAYSCGLVPGISQSPTWNVPASCPLWMGATWMCDSMTLDLRLDLQVQSAIQATNLSLTEILHRFFSGFHRWLPVVCPELFHEILRKPDDSLLPADYSVLLLSMCLVTLTPPPDTLSLSLNPKGLHLMVKTMLAHVQSVICTSPSLIQASLLLAAYEYACGRPEMALISVGTCSRMAQSIGIDKRSSVRNERQCHSDLNRRALEERNIWWGIVILERYSHVPGLRKTEN